MTAVTRFLLGLEESTLCRLKKASVKAYVLGNYAHNRLRVNACAVTVAKTAKNTYSDASF